MEKVAVSISWGGLFFTAMVLLSTWRFACFLVSTPVNNVPCLCFSFR